jgi:hypothetical protein
MFDTVAMLRAARRILMFPHVEVAISDTVVRYFLKVFTDLDGTEGHAVARMRLVEVSSSGTSCTCLGSSSASARSAPRSTCVAGCAAPPVAPALLTSTSPRADRNRV